MAKKFNITGTCFPERHYMADISAKLKKVVGMVEEGEYFIINRPRQYGKTTMLSSLADWLRRSGEYLVFKISFEGVGDVVFQNEAAFCGMFLDELKKEMIECGEKPLEDFLTEAIGRTTSMHKLSETITELATKTPKNMVLLIDEVDKSSNNQLFLSFLGMLRNKFLNRDSRIQKTFHAVVLAGVHDVKNLKSKIRPDEEQKFNSPWNIASDFRVDMNFQPAEIKPMLDDYVREKGVKMDTAAIAERLFYYTSGYPFLVSKLCKMLDEEFLPEKTNREWTEHDLELAVQRLVTESNANFDSLIKNLENNPELYRFTYELIIESAKFTFNIHDSVVSLGVLYGIFKNGNGLNIHNLIYREVIANYMAFKTLRTRSEIEENASGVFTRPDGSLDMEKLLTRFQIFMKEQYSRHDRDFLERHGRLVFLAFLKPILNGRGYTFKESQISEEKRLDVVITFLEQRYVAELKLWRGKTAHDEGLAQLADYLERLHLSEGFLVIFDHSGTKSWDNGWLEVAGKRVFAIWV